MDPPPLGDLRRGFLDGNGSVLLVEIGEGVPSPFLAREIEDPVQRIPRHEGR